MTAGHYFTFGKAEHFTVKLYYSARRGSESQFAAVRRGSPDAIAVRILVDRLIFLSAPLVKVLILCYNKSAAPWRDAFF